MQRLGDVRDRKGIYSMRFCNYCDGGTLAPEIQSDVPKCFAWKDYILGLHHFTEAA